VYALPYQVSSTAANIVTGISLGIVGWYNPFIWVGSSTFIIGCGLLCTLKVDSSTATLIGYQIIAGAGQGTANNIPYIAAQTVASKEDMSSASESFEPR
jgi:hydrogenase/urease accessory protein HupE